MQTGSPVCSPPLSQHSPSCKTICFCRICVFVRLVDSHLLTRWLPLLPPSLLGPSKSQYSYLYIHFLPARAVEKEERARHDARRIRRRTVFRHEAFQRARDTSINHHVGPTEEAGYKTNQFGHACIAMWRCPIWKSRTAGIETAARKDQRQHRPTAQQQHQTKLELRATRRAQPTTRAFRGHQYNRRKTSQRDLR